jgi:predicted RNase H-like HicB family nuclease
LSRFFAVLEKEPDGLWGVYFPDLPGCVAAAETADIAVDNAASALREVAEDLAGEGRSLPQPRTLEELHRDDEVRQALAGGAALVAVPLLIVDTAAE